MTLIIKDYLRWKKILHKKKLTTGLFHFNLHEIQLRGALVHAQNTLSQFARGSNKLFYKVAAQFTGYCVNFGILLCAALRCTLYNNPNPTKQPPPQPCLQLKASIAGNYLCFHY